MAAEIKNLKKTADRILKAIKKKEKIILYGDADLDGAASLIILKEAIKNLGGEIEAVYFPDRENEGYGLNEKALNYLERFTPALLITLDCGIGNFKEIEMAKKLGFEVIVIDHHEILDKLPKASLIVDPKQKGDKYPFKGLATAGIVFRLSRILLKKNLSEALEKNFLELAALATIADMMPQENENWEFIQKGLEVLPKTFRPGLQVFQQMNSLKNNPQQLAQKIISAIQSGETKDHLSEGYLLLSANSTKGAEILAKNLLEKAYFRHSKIKEITEAVEERISKKLTEPIVFEGDKNWPVLVMGPAASKICQNYKKPVFLYSKKEKDSQGAVRTPSGIDGVKAMGSCSEFLITYGGHSLAAGFRIKNENLEKFKECLINHFSKL